MKLVVNILTYIDFVDTSFYVKIKSKYAFEKSLCIYAWEMIYSLTRFNASEVKIMSRKCPITGKGPMSGNNRSHSVRATRRRWNVNLQNYQVCINGKMVQVRMSARAYRTLNKSIKAEAAKEAE